MENKVTGQEHPMVENLIKKFKEYENSPESKPVKVRYEFFRDFFYIPLLSKETPITTRSHFKKKWSEIAGGEFRPVDLVNVDGEVVIQVPPMLDIGVEVRGLDGLGARYSYASSQDKNFDTGAKDRVFNDCEVIGISKEFTNSWDKLIEFVETRLKISDKENIEEEDVGYVL